MKKFFLTAAMAVTIATGSIASDIKVSERVKSAFQKEFATAFNPSWESVGSGILHASFIQDNQIMDAYFTEEGELISFARQISNEQLPILVSRTIQERFSSSTISRIQEIVKGNETSYLLTAASASKVVDARIYTSGGIDILKTVKKVQQ